MRVHGKDINDECQFCEKILECELFIQGHGIRQERTNIARMMRCQFEHEQQRKDKMIVRKDIKIRSPVTYKAGRRLHIA